MSALALVKNKQEIKRELRDMHDKFWELIESDKVEEGQKVAVDALVLSKQLLVINDELEKMGIKED
jgi:hypothetical protein